MKPAVIRPFTPASADFPGAVAVYRSYAGGNDENAEGYFRLYAGRTDYAGCVAVVDGVVVGMCFGARVSSGNWWFDAVANGLAGSAHQLEQAWTLNELGVLPTFQRRGIAKQLLWTVSGAVRWPRLVLSTGIDNLPARELYRALGWIELGSVALSKTGKLSIVYLLDRGQSAGPSAESTQPVPMDG